METKPLLYGIIGFILGGLLVSIVAVNMETNQTKNNSSSINIPNIIKQQTAI